MSYNPITGVEISTGKPVSNTTLNKVKENIDNLQSRVVSLEGGGESVFPPINLSLGGDYSSMVGSKGVLLSTMNFGITITGVRLIISKAGSSGSTEVDVEFKRGSGNWTSILTTKPSVAYSEGDYAISSNTVLDLSKVNLEAGDLIRVNLTAAQLQGAGFLIRIDYLKT